MSPAPARGRARERILAAAVRRIAAEGIDGARIARIAMDAGVSPALVHYHFATRDALLAEALDYSYSHAADQRIRALPPASSHAERLEGMVEQCLPVGQTQRDDWVLWIELWLRAAREAPLRPFAAELYSRLHGWFAAEIAAGVKDGEFAPCDPDEVTDRLLALVDGVGVRSLIGDQAMTLERARRTVIGALTHELGLSEPRPRRARRSAA